MDREKVINALQQCVGYEDVDNTYTCIYDGDTNPNCPYGGTGGDGVSCMTKMMRDALAILKAQEPRVMTLEEISDWDGAVMVEYTGTFNNPMFEWLLYQVQHNQDVMFSNHNRSNVIFYANDYGKGWRCWTSRPTDEQRKAVKWG